MRKMTNELKSKSLMTVNAVINLTEYVDDTLILTLLCKERDRYYSNWMTKEELKDLAQLINSYLESNTNDK